MDLKSVVDELGMIKAQLGPLLDREKELKALLKDSGEREIEGNIFRVVIFKQMKTMIDWKHIAEKFKPSRQLVTANTSTTEITQIRVTDRKAGKAAA